MAKYRKKPVVIEAVQWQGTNPDEVSAFCVAGWFDGNDQSFIIPTLEGDMRANPSDFVIKGVKGEFYPCKPDIFEATYDVAD
ncbi:MAG: hypothetical protein LC750_07585 [Actinobacteria bacterium]|nr:hypothetical protein [Actinomycetota bacterium]